MNSVQGHSMLRCHHLYMFILSLNLFLGADCTISLSDIFLNSHYYCGHEQTNGVNTFKGYLIKPDISPQARTTSFRNCEVTFHSERMEGRVCLSQEGNLAKILDNNAQLTVYDGASDNDHEVFSLNYGPERWANREYCTNSPFLYMYLEKKDQAKTTDISQLKMLFKVQDIQSRDRTLYLEENYCDHTYELENSQVTILNRLPYDSPVPARTVNHLCKLDLNRKKNESLRTCIVYEPSESGVSCGSGWEIFVSNDRYSPLDPSTHVHTIKCDDPLAQEMHAWCAKNTTNFLSLFLSRDNTNMKSDSSEEPPGMFRLVAADYSGSEESLIELLKMQRSKASNSASSDLKPFQCGVFS